MRGVLQVGVAGGTETLHEGDALVAVSTAIVSWANPSDRPAESRLEHQRLTPRCADGGGSSRA